MHSFPNIPKFERGDNPRSQTINDIANFAKNNSVNSQGAGMHGYSTASGTSTNLDETIQKGPFWAMITGARRKYGPGQYPSLTDGDCPPIAGQFDYCFPPYNPERCPNYWYAHSWVELVENYDLTRHGEEVFPIIVDPKLPAYIQPFNNVNGGIEIYKRSCRAIHGVYTPGYGMRGDIHEYPLYEVNNMLLPVGYVTMIYPGNGAYMLVAGYDGGMYDFIFTDNKSIVAGGYLPPEKSCCETIRYGLNVAPNQGMEDSQQEAFNKFISSENLFKEPGKIVRSSFDPGQLFLE